MPGQANYTGKKKLCTLDFFLTILKNLILTNVFADGKLKR